MGRQSLCSPMQVSSQYYANIAYDHFLTLWLARRRCIPRGRCRQCLTSTSLRGSCRAPTTHSRSVCPQTRLFNLRCTLGVLPLAAKDIEHYSGLKATCKHGTRSRVASGALDLEQRPANSSPLIFVVRQGSPTYINVVVQKLTGNRRVTLLTNFEPYELDAQSLANELQLLCASSATGPYLSSRSDDELMLPHS